MLFVALFVIFKVPTKLFSYPYIQQNFIKIPRQIVLSVYKLYLNNTLTFVGVNAFF